MLILLHARLLASYVSIIGLVLSGSLFLVALLSHRAAFATAALVALIVGLLGSVVIEGWRAYALYKAGSWAMLNGIRATRAEQPKRFRLWLISHLMFAAAWGAAASFLGWVVAIRL